MPSDLAHEGSKSPLKGWLCRHFVSLAFFQLNAHLVALAEGYSTLLEIRKTIFSCISMTATTAIEDESQRLMGVARIVT
jgi:hypothetical protein